MKISSALSIVLVAVLASSILRVADSKRFRVHFDVPDYFGEQQQQQQQIDTPLNEYGHRILQQFNTSAGNRDDIVAPTTICQNHGAKFTCNVATTMGQELGGAEYTDLTLQVTCGLDSQIGWDFRRSHDCVCTAFAVHSDPARPDKACPCSVCPLGYGRNPASVDCSAIDPNIFGGDDRQVDGVAVATAEDPFLLGPCSSFDCDWNCNGTCKFDCTNPTPECEQLCGTPAPKEEEEDVVVSDGNNGEDIDDNVSDNGDDKDSDSANTEQKVMSEPPVPVMIDEILNWTRDDGVDANVDAKTTNGRGSGGNDKTDDLSAGSDMTTSFVPWRGLLSLLAATAAVWIF